MQETNEKETIKEKIKKLKDKIMQQSKFKKILILVVIFALLASCIITLTMQTIKQIQIKKIEDKPLLEYEVKNRINRTTYEIVVRINSADGIESISYIDQNTNNEIKLNAYGKVTIGIDYIVEDKKDYDFKIKIKNQDEITKTLEFERPKIQGNYKAEIDGGIYVNEPDLTGYNTNYTRYLNIDEDGNLEPGEWINGEKPSNWYNYEEQQWANIYVEANGLETYYVWIPRYCFKLDQKEQKSEVKFIDVDDNYQDQNGQVTTWEKLEKDGYQIPEAFTWGVTEIPGYWAMKYTAGERNLYTINFETTASKTKVYVKTVSKNTTENITKYICYINGEQIKEFDDPTIIGNFEHKMDTDNINYVNITALNENGEIVGSMTKECKQAKVNEPELSSFNQDTTFFVTYDEDGNEHSTIPINKEKPSDWYDYGESRWANIVTRNNELETYYVWIPRYEFKLDQTAQRSNVNFIEGIKEEATKGYQIPEAFTFNGKQLTGYWAMKYTVGDAAAPRFDTEVTATSNSIKTKGITGTEIKDGQEYIFNYYIDGTYQGTKTTAADEFEFEQLDSKKTYTILVEIRKKTEENSNENHDKGEYAGTIVKQIATIDANKPELIGFNPEKTYYVLYDENGNETIGNKIDIDDDGNIMNKPDNWYDYSKRKWANIVVTDADITEDKKINYEPGKMTTYYVWIPRYEFMITSSQYAQPTQGRTEVRFIEGTRTDTDVGYQIPEAFTFNGKQLTGYWAMKYTAGN